MGFTPNEGGVRVSNGSRHKHILHRKEGFPHYRCSGCRKSGVGVAYECRLCSHFKLHEACAVLPDDYVHLQSPFKFHSKPYLRHHCRHCGKEIERFFFESLGVHSKLHPLCMLQLPAKYDVPRLERLSRGKLILARAKHIVETIRNEAKEVVSDAIETIENLDPDVSFSDLFSDLFSDFFSDLFSVSDSDSD